MINYTYYFTDFYITTFYINTPVCNEIKIEKLNDFTHHPNFIIIIIIFKHDTFLSKFHDKGIKSHRQEKSSSTSNYSPQFRWPVNESFISNFRGGKLSCAVKFPARSTLRSKPSSSRKTGDYEINSTLIYLLRYCQTRGVRVRRE